MFFSRPSSIQIFPLVPLQLSNLLVFETMVYSIDILRVTALDFKMDPSILEFF